MTEETVGREPVQLVNIKTPLCRNRYGCLPCEAGLELVEPDLSYNFATTGTANWSATNGTLTRVVGGVRLQATAGDSQIRLNAGAAASASGSAYRYITVRGKRGPEAITEATAGTWSIFWTTSADTTFTAAKQISTKANWGQAVRGLPAPGDVAEDGEFILIFDAADSGAYATDWQGQTIERLRFDPSASASEDVTIYSIAISSADPLAATPCMNTYATCQDLPNYRAGPMRRVSSDLTVTHQAEGNIVADTWRGGLGNEEFGTILSAPYDGNIVIAQKVSFPLDADGYLFEIGNYLSGTSSGITIDDGANELIFFAGFSSGGTAGVDYARVAGTLSDFLGKTRWLFFEIETGADTLTAWSWDELEQTLTQIGTDTASSGFTSGTFASTNSARIGVSNTLSAQLTNCVISETRVYADTLIEHIDGETYGRDYWFGRAEQGKASDLSRVFPILRSVSTVGSRINLASANRDYSPLGGRATVSVQLGETFPTDREDPYRNERDYDTLADSDRGGFWDRWLVRERFGKNGALLTVFEGYDGQATSAMKARKYLLERANRGGGNGVDIRARDILTRSSVDRAQAPAPSTGVLDRDMTESDLVAYVRGATLRDYPNNGGTIRINDECMTYSAYTRQTDGTLRFTISARATDGTTGDEHSEGDQVQECLRFESETVDSILETLLGRWARVDYDFLNLSEWNTEATEYLQEYTVGTLITAPEGVEKLVGELAEQTSSVLWWDERGQVTRMKAVRPLAPDESPNTYTEDNHILADSFSIRELTDQRISQVWVFYNRADPTEGLDDAQNYLNVYIDDAQNPDQYGQPAVRQIFSRWLASGGQAIQTASRIVARYKIAPIEVTFDLDAKDRDLWVGDFCYLQHFMLRDEYGARDQSRLYLVLQAEEIVPGERVRYVAADVTLSGVIRLIAPNSQADWTGTASDGSYMFISDAFGLMSNGDRAPRLS